MKLDESNYYSLEADREYMSVSQFKKFSGTWGRVGCEFEAMEELYGRWKDEPTTAMLIGSYVDSYFDGSLDEFRENNPEIFTQKGELKSSFKNAEEIITRIERDGERESS